MMDTVVTVVTVLALLILGGTLALVVVEILLR